MRCCQYEYYLVQFPLFLLLGIALGLLCIVILRTTNEVGKQFRISPSCWITEPGFDAILVGWVCGSGYEEQ